MNAAATNLASPRPEHLAPTENAARHYIYRVHFRFSVKITNVQIRPYDWGWKHVDGHCVLVVKILGQLSC
jgi:hypothetical protein